VEKKREKRERDSEGGVSPNEEARNGEKGGMRVFEVRNYAVFVYE